MGPTSLLTLLLLSSFQWSGVNTKRARRATPPPSPIEMGDVVLEQGKTDNSHALNFCEFFRPSYQVDEARFLSFNRDEALRQLERTGRPLKTLESGPFDVELRPGNFLACGHDGAETPIIELVRPHQTCKRLVLTAAIGNKDYVQPIPGQVMDPDVCYLAFIDREAAALLQLHPADVAYANWTLIRAGDRHLPMTDPRENAKMFKHLAPRLFPRAEWSLWIEAKTRVITPATALVREHMLIWGAFMALFANHPRLSWAEEQEFVVDSRLVGPEVVMAQREEYVRYGLSTDYSGLAEGSIVLRDHRHPATHIVACNWWNEVLRYPPRDMASLNFAHHALGFKPSVAPEAFSSARDRGGMVLDRLWWTYSNPALTGGTIHVAPRCRFNMHIDAPIFSRFQPITPPNATVHGLTNNHRRGYFVLRKGATYRRVYLPLELDAGLGEEEDDQEHPAVKIMKELDELASGQMAHHERRRRALAAAAARRRHRRRRR